MNDLDLKNIYIKQLAYISIVYYNLLIFNKVFYFWDSYYLK